MSLLIALFIVCIGIGFAGYAAISGDRLGCVVEFLLGLLWIRVNHPVEGPILVVLSNSHGITVADLFSVACFGLAAFGWLRANRRRDRQAQEEQQTRQIRARTGSLPSPLQSPPNPRVRRH